MSAVHEHELAALNPPNEQYDHSQWQRWITSAKPVDVPAHQRTETLPYFATVPSAPVVPVAVPRDEWEAARLDELRRPFVARLREARDIASEYERRLQVAEKQYDDHATRELYDSREQARASLDGARVDLEIIEKQIMRADAEQAGIDWNARYAAYLETIETQQKYAQKLVSAEQAASQFAACCAELRALDSGRSDTRRRLRDMLIRGWIAQGFHPEDLFGLIRG